MVFALIGAVIAHVFICIALFKIANTLSEIAREIGGKHEVENA